MQFKGEYPAIPAGYRAWFDLRNDSQQQDRIIFGHWAALGGDTFHGCFEALDSGCVWGNALTLMNIETGERFTQPSPE